jgi:hypothetical protein
MATRKAVKKVKNAVLYDDGLIRVSNVRFSHPHLDRPYKGSNDSDNKNAVAKYGVTGMLPKDTHSAAKKLIEERIEAILKENKVKALASEKKFLRDGDESDKDEYEGHWTISAREERRPILRQALDDGTLEVVEPEDAKEVFYGGCWGSLLIRPWFQNNKYGKRVNAGLTAATKKADDEAFGEGRISEDEVDDAFEDDEDFDGPSRGKSSSRSRNRHEDDEDEDERPARRRRRSSDDDDDPDDI